MTASKLAHIPGVVRTYPVILRDGVAVTPLELCPFTLKRYAETNSLTNRCKLQLMTNLAVTLLQIHTCGFAHLDIKVSVAFIGRQSADVRLCRSNHHNCGFAAEQILELRLCRRIDNLATT